MLKLAADENFNNNIVRGLLRRKLDLDIVRIQDVGLSGVDDPTVLEWAAQEGRILLTHDVTTMTRYAYERIETGQPMPGVFDAIRDDVQDAAHLQLLSMSQRPIESTSTHPFAR